VSLTIRYAVRSDRGLVRTNNEDSVYAGPRLLAIADGMGGHAGGEVASKIVIGTVEPLDEDRPMSDLIGALRQAVAEANAALAESVENDRNLEGMGTTLTAIRFAGPRIAVVHVGDSRAYLMRAGQLTQITHDDTYVQSLVDSGELTAEQASNHPRKSVILRALTGTEVDPDISIRESRKGDRYLLCTDGLTDVVTAETLLDALSEGTPQSCADRLIDLALRGGGPDNVTCIVADVVDDGAGDEVPVVGGAVADPADEVRSEIDSPARRASQITVREPEMPPVSAVKRHGRRRVPVSLVAAMVVIGAAVGSYFWTQTQYFVGRDGTEVAIFRGVNTQFGPVTLFSVIDNSNLRVDDLTPSARGQVNNGIAARDRTDADAILARLNHQLLPLCPVAGPTPAPSKSVKPSAGRSASPSASKAPAPARTPSTSPRATRTSGSKPAPSKKSAPTVTQRPAVGDDCREAR
jgi:protein phosphatase